MSSSGRVLLLCVALLFSWSGTADAARLTGSGKHVGWNLDGRHLTLTLTKALEAPRTAAHVSCGDDASYEPGVFSPASVWADVVAARIHVQRDARVVRVTFRRDISRRVNRCVVTFAKGSDLPGGDTAMRLRHGHRPGCRPGRRERIIARLGAVRVMRTHVRWLDEGFEVGSEDAYRACRSPAQRPRTITNGGVSSGGGSSNGSRQPTMFRAAGGHIAWVEIGDYGGDPLPPSIGTVHIDGRVRKPVTFAPGYGNEYRGLGTVTQLSVTTTGAITWTLEQPPEGPTLSYSREPDGHIHH